MSLRGSPGVARPSPPDHQGVLVSNTLLPHHGRPWGLLHTRRQYVVRGIKRAPRPPSRPRLPLTPSLLQAIKTCWAARAVEPDMVMFLAVCCMGFFGFMRAGQIHRQVNSRGGPGDMPFSPGRGSGQPHQPLHGASAPETEQDRPLQAWGRHLPWPHRCCLMPSGGYYGLLRHTPSHSQAVLRLQRWLSTDQRQTGGRSGECTVPCRGRHGPLLGTQLPGGCCHHSSSCRPIWKYSQFHRYKARNIRGISSSNDDSLKREYGEVCVRGWWFDY